MSSTTKVGFVGAGNMATALVRGLTGAPKAEASRVGVTDIDPERSRALHRAHGVREIESARALCEWADVVVLAVKPQVALQVLGELSDALGGRHLLVSIAAGLTTRQLAAPLDAAVRVVRAMPNTPALVGAGATALCAGPGASDADMDRIEELFESVGRVVRVPESSMNAVTGLSGSGPAYVFLAIEALADAGVREGLPREVALELAAQTVKGAAQLVLESGEHPAALKDRVTSPAGTTITGVAALEQHGLRHALMSAVAASVQRARELGED